LAEKIIFGQINIFWANKYFLAEKIVFEKIYIFWTKKSFLQKKYFCWKKSLAKKIFGRKHLWPKKSLAINIRFATFWPRLLA